MIQCHKEEIVSCAKLSTTPQRCMGEYRYSSMHS